MISRRILAALALLCAIAAPAHAQSTKAQLNAQFTANLPDQTVGAITPSVLRSTLSSIINSIMPTAPVTSGNLACFNGTTGLLQDCGTSPTSILGTNNTWTGTQSHTDGTLILLGATSGSSTLKAPATGGGTATFFPGSDTIMGVATAQTPTNKTFNCANNTCTVRIANDVTGLGTGVATALGVNIGTAGAFVVNGGALGTPSSGTLTNATGLPLSTGVTGTLQAAQEPAHTGDCTNSAGSLALTCLNTNGAAFTANSTAAVGQLPGEPSTGNAAAGKVGEYVSASVAQGAQTAVTTATQINLVSLVNLPAGDWDIYFEPQWQFLNAATAYTQLVASVSITSATTDTSSGERFGSMASASNAPGLNTAISVRVGPARFSLSTPTTIFGVINQVFSGSTLSAWGTIRARRMR